MGCCFDCSSGCDVAAVEVSAVIGGDVDSVEKMEELKEDSIEDCDEASGRTYISYASCWLGDGCLSGPNLSWMIRCGKLSK